jgi:hypothetical protein
MVLMTWGLTHTDTALSWIIHRNIGLCFELSPAGEVSVHEDRNKNTNTNCSNYLTIIQITNSFKPCNA